MPDTHGDIEGERQIGFPGWDYHHFQRNSLTRYKVTGCGAPDNGSPDPASSDSINDPAWRILSGVERVETDHVPDDSSLCQFVNGRRICVIVPEQVDADLEFLENRIVQRFDLKSLPFGINKDIRRTVVRLSGLNQIVPGRNADNDVAALLLPEWRSWCFV